MNKLTAQRSRRTSVPFEDLVLTMTLTAAVFVALFGGAASLGGI